MIDKGRLGPFVLEQRLGRQKQGTVYHAVHLQRRRAMAVRLMSQHVGHSGATIREFAQEVEFLKTLEHPNIVRVYGGGVFDDEAYIAMELVKGESLDEVLARGGPLPWPTVVEYATQVCAGLEYAHQRGTIHQNLCTAKLLLTDDGRIKITDFRGNRLNEYHRWEAEPHLTSVAYMAPEQLRGEVNVSPKADLYALGCVIFELLTGRLPFEARTAVEMREKHLQEMPPRVTSLAFDVPVWLDALVAQLLQKDPQRRPHFASSVSVALQEVRDSVNKGIVEHVVSAGSSALSAPVGDTQVRNLVRRKKSSRRQSEWVPFYERTWFLASCVAGIIGLCTWAFWPASEEQLFAQAEALMATEDRLQWQEARDRYLQPLLERFPEGKYADRARQYLERIEMTTAQVRMENNLKLGRRGRTEGERRYAEAWQLEDEGELAEALATYQAMVQEVAPEGDDALYIKLAQQRIEKLKPAVELAAAAEKEQPEESGTSPLPADPFPPQENRPGPVQTIPAATTPAVTPAPEQQS